MTISLKDVVNKMSTGSHSATLGWDVVVNYTETQLNALLAHSYHHEPGAYGKSIVLAVYFPDQGSGKLLPLQVELRTGPPLIAFVGTDNAPTCSWTLPVDGGRCVTNDHEEKIPGGSYEIKFTGTKLNFAATFDSNSTPYITPAIFPPAADGVPPTIVTEFRDSGGLVAKLNVRDNAPKSSLVEAHKASLEEALYGFFSNPPNASSIQYQIRTAAVQLPSPIPSNFMRLHPKLFRFAMFRAGPGARPVLSVFVATAETVNFHGPQENLQQLWQNQWTSWGVSPIPDTHTASILFNGDFMLKRVVAQALQRSGVGFDGPVYESGKGHRVTVWTHKKIHRDASDCAEIKLGLSHTVGAIDVNLDDTDKLLQITFGSNDDPGSLGVVTFRWVFEYQLHYGKAMTGGGTTTIRNVLHKVCTMKDHIWDRNIKLEAGFESGDWEVQELGSDSLLTSIWTGFEWIGSGKVYAFGDNHVLPKFLYDILPTFSFSVDLDFLPTTNVLLPGKTVISIDTAAGLCVPRDFYAVGNVVA